jgi:hypothetical protein
LAQSVRMRRYERRDPQEVRSGVLDKDLAEVPTILQVFAASESPAPAEMTVWDKALLQSLYTTPQKSRVQLSQMETTALNLLVAR